MNRLSIKEPYIKINLILAGIIACILIYSGLFSPEKGNYPIPSNIKTISGKSPASDGLSRAFSAIVRFRFEEARRYNTHSIQVFSFFLLQFAFRIVAIPVFQVIQKKKAWLAFDILLSILLFVYAFSGFIREYISAILPG